MDEQIITRILVCLPPKSVYRFRLVSKSWNRLISHPFFIQRYDSQLRRRGGAGMLALFQDALVRPEYLRPGNEKVKKSLMNILPLDLPGNCKIQYNYLELELGNFINSSNGLVLWGGRETDKYYVLNPMTKRVVTLPSPPPPSGSDTSIGLMCEENRSELAAKYIVVRTDCCVNQLGGHTLRMVTYSSETGIWATAEPAVIAPAGEYLPLVFTRAPLVMNGVFHWYIYWFRLTLALYRPSEEQVQVIDVRHYDEIGQYWISTAMTMSSIEDGDMLLFGGIDAETMRVFMLTKDSEDGANPRPSTETAQEWVLIYDISVNSIWNDIGLLSSAETGRFFMEAFIPLNNKKALIALIRWVQCGVVYLYNLDTKSIQSVAYHGQPPVTSQQLNALVYDHSFIATYPYLEPSSLSTYAL
ncbi:unnamed protein product [Cuscuta epithymum]|uniref:F-box domain-containing protein n=1 Tax=Cuscuta epithymum TaxID=186058 RepID=A0AAV0F9H8_9ASTE|nr:unnamed protein product [Cuscuta epithymum]